MKSFYDFNTSSPKERQERNRLYPELANFHIALREELSEEEYQGFYNSEKESMKPQLPQKTTQTQRWIHI